MATVETSHEAMATVANKAPITSERKLPEDLDTKLPKPCNHSLLLLFLCVFDGIKEYDILASLRCHLIKGSKGGNFNGV